MDYDTLQTVRIMTKIPSKNSSEYSKSISKFTTWKFSKDSDTDDVSNSLFYNDFPNNVMKEVSSSTYIIFLYLLYLHPLLGTPFNFWTRSLNKRSIKS